MMLVIDRKHTQVGYQAGCLQIQRPGAPTRQVPLTQIELLVVHGSPLIAAGVWRELTHHGVPVVLLAGRGSRPPAVLGNGLATQLPVRRMQHRCADDAVRSARIAAWFVEHKLRAGKLPLEILRSWRGQGRQAAFDRFAKTIDTALAGLRQADTVATVTGIEGHAGRAWFQLLAETLPGEWQFAGRNRRPPRDPLNALLSLGYTLLHADVRQQVIAYGLDPALGFLHQDYPGRESLVLDCCEPWRSGVDALVLGMLRDDLLVPRDFYYRKEEGCRLSKSARPAFYEAWSRQREAWPGHRQHGALGTEPSVECQPLRQWLGGFLQSLRARLKEEVNGSA